ncbi:ABC transporter ATP-binding protein [Clostridium gasigenes]|uniref:ATP-binding cassette, subfamily B n=1 Tax=Clostridium gasigenes TaxID=94869 RepID=A0A1H0MKA1_9CLOT|nr:ABC transporter ATP-binding protein [Clostridium gasigenes]MBU3086929.1 ABC transporter ATP-binding protein/permease [Clostridium gasigenes]SDO80797.1 ATP-binding cassette, subfamily B [Clostridium gasigenes]
MFRVLKYVLRHKVSLIIGSLSMILIIGIDLCVPYLQKIFLDEGITGGDTTVIIPIIVAFLLISIVKAILGYLKEYLYDITSSEVHAEIKKDIFNHIQGLEFKYFDEMNTGELMTRIGEDAENIWQTIGFGLRLFVENILYFVLSTIILFYLNWKLALACVVIMIPIGFIAIKLEKKFGECYGKISDKTAEINTTAQENIAGVRLVKAFAREKHEVTKFLKMNRSYYDLNIQQAKIVGKYFPPIEFLTNISLVIMIILGGYFVINEEITLGVLVAFSGYIWNLIWPMRMLGYLTDILSRNSASAKKIFAIIDRESKVVSKKYGYEAKSIKGEIEFKNVTFKYNDIDVLKDINLIVPSGSTVAIMGTTGSGKSTLINLIGRYYDVYKGEVLVDKVNVKDYNLNMLRSHMAIVPQDTFLFSDSIINNIKFSSDKASEEDVINICRAACCLDFIENLEEGFNSEIGERGLGLSGGQKQRIAIARALLRDASLLILDDSTSALDTETEQTLLTNLNNREKTCTTFIIAHRISAVKNADIIIYIEDGQIKEKGNHKELLQKKGAYYDIYCEQFKDFETIKKEVI